MLPSVVQIIGLHIKGLLVKIHIDKSIKFDVN